MPAAKAAELADHLEQEGLRPVYALVGEDEALISESISLLKAAVEKPELPGSSVQDMDGLPEPSAVFDELRTLPFMGTPGVRLVIVRAGTQFIASHGAAIVAYLARPSRTGVLVLCRGPQETPKRATKSSDEDKSRGPAVDIAKKVAKAVGQAGLIVDCSPPKWASAKNWLRTEAHRAGKTVTPAAADALLEAVGPDLMALRRELEKLLLYAVAEKTINERHVEEIVPQSRSRSIFELSDAVARREVAKALSLGQHLLLSGETPEGIIAFLARQLRKLSDVKRLAERGADQKEIARELFRGMDFAARKAVQSVRSLDQDWFARRVEILAAADENLKTTSVQTREQLVWFSSLLAELCL